MVIQIMVIEIDGTLRNQEERNLELTDEELAKNQREGKIEILSEARALLNRLYWYKVKEEKNVWETLRDDWENHNEVVEKVNLILRERENIIDEIRKIDEQLDGNI